jgi:hypothetical protein
MVSLTGRSMSAEMQQCNAVCVECYRMCMETLSYCLQRGGAHADESLVRLLLDCADLCRLSNDLLVRRSDWHGRLSSLCAEACAQCARRCAEFPDDAQMAACAEVCLRCASTCKRMDTAPAVSYDKAVADSYPASDPPAVSSARSGQPGGAAN